MKGAIFSPVRSIKLTGREATVVKTIGFTDSMLGSDIQDMTKMELEDVADTLNGLMSAGFIESIPYKDEVPLAEIVATAFELNPAYSHDIRRALTQR